MKKTIATALLTIATALALVACGDGGGETTAPAPPDTTASKPPAHHQEDAGAAKGKEGNQGQGGSQGQDGEGSKGGDSGTGGGSGATGDTSASFTPPVHHDSPTGAAPFEAKGGDNSIQEFGADADNSEFEAAATALHGYLDARAAGAWRDACSYMSPGAAKSLAQLGSGDGASCPETIASLSATVPAAALREAAEAEVGALRTEGDRAFLLFHGAHGLAYFMPMASEDGTWKVAAIAASAIP